MKKSEIIERLLEKYIGVFEYKGKYSVTIQKQFSNRKDCVTAVYLIHELLKKELALIKNLETK